MGWLIAYDIACPRRWRRVHGLLLREATKLQYSLFWSGAGFDAARALAARIEPMIDPRADDVRVYALPDGARVTLHGVPPWPPGLSNAASRRFGSPLRASADVILRRDVDDS